MNASPERPTDAKPVARTESRNLLVGLLRSLRPEQWIKNGFVVAPLIFAGAWTRFDTIIRVGWGTLFFCFASSAVYLLNDLLDTQADRSHPHKRNRPIARGDVPRSLAWIFCAVLALSALAGAYLLTPMAVILIGAYLAINVLYTFFFKHQVILDVFSIAAGFVLRVTAGVELAEITASPWLLVCTAMLAIFLGFSKRRHELQLRTDETRRVLAQYSEQFLDEMMALATALCVMAYLMYTVAPDTQSRFGYRMMWTLPWVLYGIFRYQYLVYHRRSAANPSDTLLTDIPLLLAVAGWASTAIFIVGNYGTIFKALIRLEP